MTEKQFTIKEDITIEGVGLHTGQSVKMVIKPTTENAGLVSRELIHNKP